MIVVENVVKEYKRGRETVRALDDVSLSIPKGSMALMCGSSGSGKTTLINICAGLATASAGCITVAGNNISQMSQAARASLRAERVAVVFQMFHLVPYLTACENILLPAINTAVPDAFHAALALMEQLGIAHRMHHRPGEMSAGERQRCALARALINRPSVILADEPTGNLDDESSAIVLQTLDTCRREGTTILLVSHQSVDVIQPDMVLRLDKGRLVDDNV